MTVNYTSVFHHNRKYKLLMNKKIKFKKTNTKIKSMDYGTALGKHQALQCSFLMTLTLIFSHYYRKYLGLKEHYIYLLTQILAIII